MPKHRCNIYTNFPSDYGDIYRKVAKAEVLKLEPINLLWKIKLLEIHIIINCFQNILKKMMTQPYTNMYVFIKVCRQVMAFVTYASFWSDVSRIKKYALLSLFIEPNINLHLLLSSSPQIHQKCWTFDLVYAYSPIKRFSIKVLRSSSKVPSYLFTTLKLL